MPLFYMTFHKSIFRNAAKLIPRIHRLNLKRFSFIALSACALTVSGCTSLDFNSEVSIDADAEVILKKMSDKLAAAERFTVSGSRNIDPSLLASRKLKQNTKFEGAVIRPDRIAATSTSGGLTRRFIYEGDDVTLHDVEMNHYATVKGASTIDRTIDKIIAKWDFHPPMADLLVSNPYRSLTQGALSGKTNGTQWIGGTKCQRIAVTKDEVNWEIWIASTDHLPRKLEITFKNQSGQPKVQLLFQRWNLNPKLKDSQFTFDPPKGAMEIEMAPAD